MIEVGKNNPHAPPDPISAVPCPLRAHQPIAMGRCVEYQRDNGCHCEHALVALRRTEKHLAEPRKHQETEYEVTTRCDELDGVRTLMERAEQMEKARPPPAPEPSLVDRAKARRDRIHEIEQRLTMADKKKCTTPGCTAEFRSEKYDKCWRCRVGAKDHLQTAPAPTPTKSQEKKPAPPPAKEKPVGEARRYEMGPCKHPGCKTQIATSRSKSGLCGPHRLMHAAPGASSAPKPVGPVAPKLPRKVNNVRVLPPAKPAAHIQTAPPIFKDLPKIESLPPEYLIACARYLYELRKRIEFALAGEAFHVEHNAAPGA